ncbi:MAG: hypothetical protein AAF580_04555 [Pseudomonadota bacterium]
MLAARFALALAVGLASASGATAFSVAAPPPLDRDVVSVQDRFLPRIFGRGEQQASADAAMRIDRLEAEVRRLTGELEELRFTVQRLEAALGQPNAVVPQQQSGAQPAPQQLAAEQPQTPITPAAPAAQTQSAAIPSGPIDLSALNSRFDNAAADGFGAPQGSVVQPDVSLDNPSLSEARMLMNSGRYQLAMEKVVGVLGSNPSTAEASEARFLAGEALMAQGDLRGAANYFLENYTTDPNGARAPESLVRLSRAFNQLGEGQAACSSIEELFGAYPNVPAGLRAQAEVERQAARCS